MGYQVSIPNYDDLFEPTIKALKILGGSGNIQEIYEKVCELEGYSEEQQSILHKEGPQTEISYRLAWARTYLKNYGAIESSRRGFWSLTEKGRTSKTIDKREINRVSKSKKEKNLLEIDEQNIVTPIPIESHLWAEKLLTIVQKKPLDSCERSKARCGNQNY